MPDVKPIPDGYHSLQPYLILNNCAEAIAFYEKALGAKEKFRMPNAAGRIQHAEIQIGDCVLMLADEAPQMEAFSPAHYGGSPVSFLVYTENCDALYERAVQAGAEGIREPADQPYGDRMAGVKDPYGYRWYLSTHIKDAAFGEMSAQG
jgi:PhnB protein